jgi:hypothetical protein
MPMHYSSSAHLAINSTATVCSNLNVSQHVVCQTSLNSSDAQCLVWPCLTNAGALSGTIDGEMLHAYE